jgi:nitrate/TMAO reductase-like tetraheme cytochrome c subunit
MFRPFRALVAFLPRLWTNWLTLFGAVLTSVSATAILTALAIDLTSSGLNPYSATILFLVMPGLFALGLSLIPLGLYFDRRRQRKHVGEASAIDPLLEGLGRAMASSVARRRVLFVLLMSVVNVFIFATVTHRAVSFMETPRFCGNVCHSVMQPEFDAYNTSPHNRVACVECHIGAGAVSAVKAKMSGLRQLWGIASGSYHRPIQTPVHNLRSARETCENCHDPARFARPKLGFRVRYKEDEGNTPQVTAMTFRLGGKDPATGDEHGIHWHASHRFQVRYEVLDDKRQIIGRIQKLDNGKVVDEWLPAKDAPAPASSAAAAAAAQPGTMHELRTMDCVDCHNRATHVYDGTPENAVNKALAQGLLDRKLPWLRKTALAVLAGATPPRESATEYFRKALEDAYRREHPAQMPAGASLDAAARGLGALYRRNVYPAMKLTWNQYPSNIGHGGPDPGETKAQCFRCHSGDHKTTDGREISSKCESCHEVIAKDEVPDDLPDEIRSLY